MANKELELYEIIDALANSAVPLMFKGALITKLVLSENGYKGELPGHSMTEMKAPFCSDIFIPCANY